MADKKQNNAEQKGFYKESIFLEFVRWSALPAFERSKMDIRDQTEFAEAFGVNKDTLTRWKRRPDFEGKVNELRMSWGKQRTPTVLNAIFDSALKGKARSQKLWLEYFTNFNSPPSKLEEEKQGRVVLDPSDIRFMLDALPEPLRTKHYQNLASLIADMVQTRDKALAADPNDPVWSQTPGNLKEKLGPKPSSPIDFV